MEFNVPLFYFITLILLIALQSTGSTQMDGEVRCITLYAPVCGKDGKTYGNFCELRGANQMCAYCGECSSCKPSNSPPNCPNCPVSMTGECLS